MSKKRIIGVAIVLVAIATLRPLSLDAQNARKNLGENVNSELKESVPVLSPDGRTLYFLRDVEAKRDDQEYDKDIYYSTLNADGTWSEAQLMGEPLNTWDWNFMLSILPDGNTALLSYVYNDDGSTSNGFSISRRTSAGWQQPQQVRIDNYQNKNKYTGAFLCNDGRTLIISVEPDDSYGDLDLYVSFMRADGSFTAPRNLGRDINTSGSDGTPFMASDGITLYFSSDGRGGYGGDDIFITRRLDDSWQKWSTPVNMGPIVNTPEFDAYYTLSAEGEYAYLVSFENSFGSSDIFRVELPDSLKPRPVTLISGKVFDAKTKQPIEAEIRYELLPGGDEAGRATATQKEGYQVVLPAGARYGVRAEATGYYPINENLDLTTATTYREEHRDLYLAPIEIGTTIRLNNIFFGYGKSDLAPESAPELDRVAMFLQKNPSMRIAIGGHSDDVGPDAFNLMLSKKRASAVFDYLIAHGVDKARLSFEGFGEAHPIATNETEEGRGLNRRVEFTIVAQ